GLPRHNHNLEKLPETCRSHPRGHDAWLPQKPSAPRTASARRVIWLLPRGRRPKIPPSSWKGLPYPATRQAPPTLGFRAWLAPSARIRHLEILRDDRESPAAACFP